MVIDGDTFLAWWFVIGAASHFFWWGMMGALRSGVGWMLCLLSLVPAAPLGIVTFVVEALLYWLTSPHDDWSRR